MVLCMQRRMWIVMLVIGAVFAVPSAISGEWRFALTYAAFCLTAAWWMHPMQGGRTVKHAEVMARPEAERGVVVYWRPGCIYSARLKGRLGRLRKQVTWVNIWQDEGAAAYVESVNHGDQLVPTVVINGVPHANPDAEMVRRIVAGEPEPEVELRDD